MQRTYGLVAVTFQVFRLATVHCHDWCALRETFSFIIGAADDGEYRDATIRIISAVGAANATRSSLRRVAVDRDIHLILDGVSGNRMRAHG